VAARGAARVPPTERMEAGGWTMVGWGYDDRRDGRRRGADQEAGAGAEGGRRGAPAGPYPARAGGWERGWAAGVASCGGDVTASGGGRRWGGRKLDE
jgi:hypothetical protein